MPASSLSPSTTDDCCQVDRATENGLESAPWLDCLPASYREDDNLFSLEEMGKEFIGREFRIDRLEKIMRFLWIAGRPAPPRPLHQQLVLERQIVLTESLDMHLVWNPGRMFLKPIPRYLFKPQFWTHRLQDLADENTKRGDGNGETRKSNIRSILLGFLASYAALIVHESDFHVARDARLIPKELQWREWRSLVQRLLKGEFSGSVRRNFNIYEHVCDRFIYGELRLNRLNLIYTGLYVTSYFPRWHTYGSFYRETLDLVIAGTVYIVVILTAMQVGLATNQLNQNDAFQAASYGFTILAILGPLAAIGLIIGVFIVAFVANWAWSAKREKKRAEVLMRDWRPSQRKAVAAKIQACSSAV